MTMLYPNPCYNEVCYKETALYFIQSLMKNGLLAFITLYIVHGKYFYFSLLSSPILYHYLLYMYIFLEYYMYHFHFIEGS